MRFDAATGLGTDGGQWHMILPWAPLGKPRWRASDTVSRRRVESGWTPFQATAVAIPSNQSLAKPVLIPFIYLPSDSVGTSD